MKSIRGNALTDEELISGYKTTGELGLLGELYQRYMDLVYGVCLKYFKDPERSRDAVMQIFEELISKLRKHEVEYFRSWLYQLAKNHCLMQLRTPRNLKTVELNPALVQNTDFPHLNGMMEKEENLERLENCLGTLVPDQQEAIRLFYLEGKCYNEIVDITGQDWNQVKSFIQNGRRNLKLCMEKRKKEQDEK